MGALGAGSATADGVSGELDISALLEATAQLESTLLDATADATATAGATASGAGVEAQASADVDAAVGGPLGLDAGIDADLEAQLSADANALTTSTLATVHDVSTGAYDAVATTRARVEAKLDALAEHLGVPPATVQALVTASVALTAPLLQTTCATLATLTPLVPKTLFGLSLDTGIVSATAAAALDKQMSDLVALQTAALTAALSPAQLDLLRLDWSSILRTSTGATVDRGFLGYLGLPTLMDVDGLLGYDLCGQLTIDPSTGEIVQVITRLALAPAVLPVNVSAGVTALAGLSFGYNTPGSKAPVSFKSVIRAGTGGALLAIDNTVSGAGAELVQRIELGNALDLGFTWTGVPARAHVDLGFAGAALSAGLNTSSRTRAAVRLRLGSAATLSAEVDGLLPSSQDARVVIALPGAGLQATFDGRAGDGSSSFFAGAAIGTLPLSVRVSPLAAKIDSCALLASIACSDVNARLGLSGSAALSGLGSLHLKASSDVSVEQIIGAGASCAPGANHYASLTGREVDASWSLAGTSGHAFVDTGGLALRGCLNSLTFTGTFTDGIDAELRLGRFALLGLVPHSIAKVGRLVCSAATKFTLGPLDRTAWLCPTPPLNTVLPKITGTAKVNVQLGGSAGSWATANAATTVALQWKRCDAAGGNCVAIAGATSATYRLTAADVGARIVLTATASNADGTVSATSAATAAVTV